MSKISSLSCSLSGLSAILTHPLTAHQKPVLKGSAESPSRRPQGLLDLTFDPADCPDGCTLELGHLQHRVEHALQRRTRGGGHTTHRPFEWGLQSDCSISLTSKTQLGTLSLTLLVTKTGRKNVFESSVNGDKRELRTSKLCSSQIYRFVPATSLRL